MALESTKRELTSILGNEVIIPIARRQGIERRINCINKKELKLLRFFSKKALQSKQNVV